MLFDFPRIEAVDLRYVLADLALIRLQNEFAARVQPQGPHVVEAEADGFMPAAVVSRRSKMPEDTLVR